MSHITTFKNVFQYQTAKVNNAKSQLLLHPRLCGPGCGPLCPTAPVGPRAGWGSWGTLTHDMSGRQHLLPGVIVGGRRHRWGRGRHMSARWGKHLAARVSPHHQRYRQDERDPPPTGSSPVSGDTQEPAHSPHPPSRPHGSSVGSQWSLQHTRHIAPLWSLAGSSSGQSGPHTSRLWSPTHSCSLNGCGKSGDPKPRALRPPRRVSICTATPKPGMWDESHGLPDSCKGPRTPHLGTPCSWTPLGHPHPNHTRSPPLTAAGMGWVEWVVWGAVEARQTLLTVDACGVMLRWNRATESRNPLPPALCRPCLPETLTTDLATAPPTWQSMHTPPPW